MLSEYATPIVIVNKRIYCFSKYQGTLYITVKLLYSIVPDLIYLHYNKCNIQRDPFIKCSKIINTVIRKASNAIGSYKKRTKKYVIFLQDQRQVVS